MKVENGSLTHVASMYRDNSASGITLKVATHRRKGKIVAQLHLARKAAT